MPWSLPHRKGNGGGHVHTQYIVMNRILRQLSADELQGVQPWLTPMQLRPNVVLHEQGAAIDRIYFPLSGMISLLAVMQSGEAIETGIIGSEGLLGGDAPINGHLKAWITLKSNGSSSIRPDELARRICHLAMEGERDPVRLHDRALGELIPATMWRELS